MNKVKKFIALSAKCIRNPSLIKKGFSYISKNGIRGFINQTRVRANYEYLSSINSDEIQENNSLYNSNIKYSVLMPTYNVEPKWLEKAIDSVKSQNYINWELCIVDDCSTLEDTKEYLRSISNDRIKIIFSETKGGISVATNKAAEMATGDYIVLLDNDDVITPNALYEFTKKIKSTGAEIVYSDHDIIDENDKRRDPVFKPDWSPDLINCQMYIGHLLGFKKELFDEVGGFRTEFDGIQDYDLFLRISEQTEKISHIDRVLYSWRALPSSTPVNPDSESYAQTTGLNAVQEHLDRLYGKDVAKVDETENLFVYDVRYRMENPPKVSIIIPTKDHCDLLKQLIDSIFEITKYPEYEIIIINNKSEEEETFRYFDELKEKHTNVFVHDVFTEFNWSFLNNYGIKVATGDVYIFLNNDTKIVCPDWITRLAENAIREEVGVVGSLLLYEDDSIQHAGVVLGMNGWADHVFKGMAPVYHSTPTPYVSPMVTRNVLAVTGACMAISRVTIEKIGVFNDDFIICGSDVEICLRAYRNGMRNVYTPFVKLYHYESKSRDSYIPDSDFTNSARYYAPYKEEGDPYYNSQLDYCSCVPKIDYTKNNIYNKDILTHISQAGEFFVFDVRDYTFRVVDYPRTRINLLLPSINPDHIFGGISTALYFYNKLCEKTGFDRRIIIVDFNPVPEAKAKYSKEYTFVDCAVDSEERNQIVAYANRDNVSIPVSSKDIFIETAWWTAYCLHEAYKVLEKKEVLSPNPFIYFIQDYEPGFYPWSSKYVLADASYKSSYNQIAVFNSTELMNNMKSMGYSFYKEYAFDPVFNSVLKNYFTEKCMGTVKKKKQILLYGRLGATRNAFELIVMALCKWVWMCKNVDEWEIISLGESFNDINIGNGKVIKVLGKLTLEEYAKILKESYAGISLMISPHPSYPPLEMATYGVKVITNKYENKDLSYFSKNIVSIDDISPGVIAEKLNEICDGYTPEMVIDDFNKKYVNNDVIFPFLDNMIKECFATTKFNDVMSSEK